MRKTRILNKNARGISIIEMLAVIALVTLTLTLTGSLLRSLTTELPNSNRDFNEYITVCDLLDSIRADVEQGQLLEQQQSEADIISQPLMITSDIGSIVYTISDGQVTKTVKASDENSTEQSSSWPFKGAVIGWQVHENEQQSQSLEINTHISRKVDGKSQEKLSNTHIFLVGAATRDGQKI